MDEMSKERKSRIIYTNDQYRIVHSRGGGFADTLTVEYRCMDAMCVEKWNEIEDEESGTRIQVIEEALIKASEA